MKKILSASLATLFLMGLFFSTSSFTLSKMPKSNRYAPRWEKLGEIQTLFDQENAEITVKPIKGYFTALKLKVKGGAVSIQKMVIHFRKGITKEIALRNNFEDGSESRVIDLRRNKRAIEKVVIWYQVTPTGSKPTIELWGRH